jgi:hypothetical protein
MGEEMNNKKKWTKSIMIALLVALASLATTGLVLADHYPPVGSVSRDSLTSFGQYQAAIEHMEEDRIATLTAARTKVVDLAGVRFVPYLDEFDQTSLDRSNVTIISLDSFESYPDEFDRIELHWLAAKAQAEDDSVLRWEQYLMFAK